MSIRGILVMQVILGLFWLSTAGAEMTPVRLAHATWVGYGPLYIAQENGYFSDENIDVELFIIEDEAQYAAALASGNIDGLANVIDREVIHFAKGTSEVAIFAMDESAGGDGIIATEEIQSVSDLAGKSIGLDKSSTSYFFFLSVLDKYGVDEESMTFHEMGASNAGAGFVAGKLDAAVTWEPWLSKSDQREGGHVLLSSEEMPKTIVDVVVLNRDFVKEHPEVPTGLTRAWYRAIAWYRSNPEKGNAIMADAMGLDTEEMAAMAEGVRFIGREGNQEFFDRTQPDNIYSVADRALDFWRSKGIITAPVQAEELVTSEYVNKAAE